MALETLIETIAKALVQYPDEVEVGVFDEDDNSIVVELRVAPEDVGKVIGRDGRTAQHMRTLLSATTSKMGRRAHLDILD